MKSALFVGALAAMSSVAQAGIIFESESNDTIATADDLGVITDPGGSILVDGRITPGSDSGGSITPGDVDWFAITFTGPTDLVMSIFSLSNPLSDDSELMLVGPDGTTIIAFDDDSNIEYMSSIQVFGLAAGTYYIGVSGYPDTYTSAPTIFDGLDDDNGDPVTENFSYKLIIGANVIPAPGAAATLGLIGLAAIRRRR